MSIQDNGLYMVLKRDRTLLVLLVTFLIASVSASVLLTLRLLPDETDHLAEFQSPVILNRQPNIEGRAVRTGTITVVRTESCANRQTAIETFISWQNVETGRTVRHTDGTRDSSGAFQDTLLKGCKTDELALAVPEDVKPGDWRLSAVVIDKGSGEVRILQSEPFLVVP